MASLQSVSFATKPDGTSKGFALGADFLVPIFYPGTKYTHKGLADAKMIGGIVTGFFEAYIEYYGLTEADLGAARREQLEQRGEGERIVDSLHA